MGTMLEFRCRTLGSPEYVLARAGLLRVDADDVKAGDKLARLYGKTPMPPLVQIVPALVAVAYVCNAQLGGAIDVREQEVKAFAALEEIGITHKGGALHAVFAAIEAVIADVAEECRNRGVSSSGTGNWNKLVIRRVFPGLRGRNQAVLARLPPELDV
jgi:hypothetical protein